MMTTVIVIVFCGVLIGLALGLLVHFLRKMTKGKCCEGCSGCPQTDICSSREPPKQEKEENSKNLEEKEFK